MRYIIFGVVLLVISWLEFSHAQLSHFKKEARQKWVRVESMIKIKGDLILELLESLAAIGINTDNMVELYEIDGGASRETDREKAMEIAEEAGTLILALFEEVKERGGFNGGRPEELKKEIEELDQELLTAGNRFNQAVISYNQVVTSSKYRLQNKIIRPILLREFKMEWDIC